MSPRTLVLLIVAAATWALPSFVSATTDVEAEHGAVVVADVRGPLDQRTLDYLERSVRTPDAQLVVIQLDAPGIASGDPQALIETLRTAEVATAMWVGPDGAEAYGGAGSLLFEVDVVWGLPQAPPSGGSVPQWPGGPPVRVTYLPAAAPPTTNGS